MEALISIVVLGLAIAIIVCARLLWDTKPKPATGVPVAPRRITSDDFEIVRREASRD
jgi:hypothetical protein